MKRILPDRPLTRKEIQERYRLRHPEKCIERSRRYRENNREKMRAATRKWKKENLDKTRSYGRNYVKTKWKDPEWRALIRERKRRAYQQNIKHRESRKRSNSKWNRSEKGRHYLRSYENIHRRGDRHGCLSFEEWKEILELQNNTCAICKERFTELLKPQRDHIIPFSKGGRLVKGNVQALCKPCNARKGGRILGAA